MSRFWQILSVFALTIGLICLFLSPFLPAGSLVLSIALGLGIAMLPAGLISIITAVSSSHIIEEGVRTTLEKTTTHLRDSIQGLEDTSNYLNVSRQLGLTMVYPNRQQALRPFMGHLEDYVLRTSHDSEMKHIVFVGMSLKGVIEDPNIAQQLERIILSGRENCRFYFLLTHPEFSEFRDIQENRPQWGIALEILHAISWIENRGIASGNIRLYKGTPTCFLIASTEKMLINPYPYELEAYRCFCLELENVKHVDSMFASYWINHFHRPWHGELSSRDHYHKPNSLGYIHSVFDGPLPEGCDGIKDKLGAFADFFIINDIGSFYLAVNINGLESEVVYHPKENGSYEIMKIGRKLSVKLLDRTEGTHGWDLIGTLQLDEARRGFWQAALDNMKALEAYSMIGVFDDQAESPFMFQEDALLQGSPLPLLWKELPRAEGAEDRACEAPLPFGK